MKEDATGLETWSSLNGDPLLLIRGTRYRQKRLHAGYTFFLEQEKKRETEIISAFAYCRQQTKEKQGVPWHWLLRMTAHKLGKSKTNGKSSEEYR